MVALAVVAGDAHDLAHAARMAAPGDEDDDVHSLGDQCAWHGHADLLLGGAPRTVAIANGTLAAAVGLGLQLWIPGLVLWIVGHSLAVWGARMDAQFMAVFARHIKHRPLQDV